MKKKKKKKIKDTEEPKKGCAHLLSIVVFNADASMGESSSTSSITTAPAPASMAARAWSDHV